MCVGPAERTVVSHPDSHPDSFFFFRLYLKIAFIKGWEEKRKKEEERIAMLIGTNGMKRILSHLPPDPCFFFFFPWR